MTGYVPMVTLTLTVGVIYTLGAQPETTIAFNYVRDAAHVWAGVGFHHDAGSEGITDHSNVVWYV
jgi:hypothetical protein